MASLVDPLLPLPERMPGLPQEADAASGADPMSPAPYRIHQQRQELSDAFILELRPADGSTGASFPPGQFNRRCAFGLGEVPISISGNPAQPAALVPTTYYYFFNAWCELWPTNRSNRQTSSAGGRAAH